MENHAAMLCKPFTKEEMADYRKNLAVLLGDSRKTRKDYTKRIQKMLAKPLQDYQLEELFDSLTGGVVFYDDEWALIDKDDPLKVLFGETDEQSCYKYILPLDGKILLRGPDIYYFFSCYLSRFKDPSHKQYEIWFENVVDYLDKASDAIYHHNFYGASSRRLFLGVLDNIRNVVLILATAEMLCSRKDTSLLFEEADLAWIKTIKICHELMHDFYFSNIDYYNQKLKVENLILEILKDMPVVREAITKTDDGYLLLKSVNPWREADNYLENFVGMMYVADHMREAKRVHLIGLLCGGLELPLILGGLLQADVTVSFLFQRTGLYMEKTAAFQSGVTAALAMSEDKESLTIIVDENAQSGISAQLAVQRLDELGIPVHKVALLRAPAIARLEQMKNSGAAITLELFGHSILGGIFPSPYTRLKKGTNYGGMYLDEMGLFSYGAEVFLKALYKNNTFIRDSEVDIFKGFLKGKDEHIYE